jgi:hypothetical protein
MATPTFPSKRYYAAGVAKGTTWGTAAAVGAGKGILITNDGGLALKQKYVQHDDIDKVMPQGGVLGPVEAIEWAPPFHMRYDPGLLGSLIACLFGTAGAPTQQGATTAYKHVIKTADTYTNFYTYAGERPGRIWEVPSFIPYKLSLNFANGFLEGVISLLGNNVVNNSSVNGATQVDALTYVDVGNRIKVSELVTLWNAEGGAALASPADLLGDITSIAVEYERPVDRMFPAGTSGIGRPKDLGPFKATVKVKLERALAATTYEALFANRTAQKMTITGTGALIATPYYYSLLLGFTRLIPVEPPKTALADMMVDELEFIAEESAAAPTGMTGYTRPFIEMINLQTTDYLA